MSTLAPQFSSAHMPPTGATIRTPCMVTSPGCVSTRQGQPGRMVLNLPPSMRAEPP